ncbi:putative integral membrane protein [Rosellinia necatrix]|uniref:Putative integral membrane protein n=1 Tax=Rosellinia necatrix TaxID=77044 RepID=A0A1S7UJ77_ROSNE|nr:putative integral membrane protein [Rosellinia necatrix]
MGMAAKRWHLCFLWGLSVILILLNILAIVLIIRLCDPPQKQWEPSIPGTCLNPIILEYAGLVQSSYNALMDIVVAIFPALFITKLSVSRKTKIGLSLLMGGGVFAAGATVVKVYLLKDIDKLSDITWYWAPISLWYTAEVRILQLCLIQEQSWFATAITNLL